MAMNILILSAALIIWGAIHSWSASQGVKDFFMRTFGINIQRIYRLGYNFFSIVSLLPILLLLPYLPDHTLYRLPFPWMVVTLGLQGLAVVFLVIGLWQTGVLTFIGLSQLVEPQAQTGQLMTTGLYRFVRHPLYLFGLLFIWLTPFMTVNLLTVFVCLTLYIFIGAHFEERRLLREFGQAYADYMQRTPMILPGLLRKRSRFDSHA